MKRVLAVGFVLILLLVSALPAAAQDQSIVEIALADEQFSTLVSAASSAGLVDALSGEGPMTVFAPTNDAFAKLPEGTLDSLDTEQLTAILTYHVVLGKVLAADAIALDGKSVETLNGEEINISVVGGSVMINDATVIAADIEATNGVIHVIDTVLMPPSMMADTTMEEAAPEALPETGAALQADQTIVEIALADPQFSTLVSAASSAGLADALAGEGPFTVFAPTNDAFAKLPEGTLESLDTEALTAILTYHVVPGKVLAADVVALDGKSVTTLGGEDVNVTVSGDMVMINDATVILADVEASNGVIHVIDTVLMPPSMMADTMMEDTAPETIAETGAGPSTTLPLAAATAGLILLAGGYVLRRKVA